MLDDVFLKLTFAQPTHRDLIFITAGQRPAERRPPAAVRLPELKIDAVKSRTSTAFQAEEVMERLPQVVDLRL
ncbi:MAG: hypothetical protein LBF89_02455 [Bacteroidales bacterium]|nr:hypothetical protein [Bacteroidales bacterium]